jgi:hypothetical protein
VGAIVAETFGSDDRGGAEISTCFMAVLRAS